MVDALVVSLVEAVEATADTVASTPDVLAVAWAVTLTDVVIAVVAARFAVPGWTPEDVAEVVAAVDAVAAIASVD